MDYQYKIFGYLDQLKDSYAESVQIVDGLQFNHKATLRTIEYYSNNQYESGKYDAIGREKPFYNVCNYRVTVAKTATDLDVKDIRYEPDSTKDAVAAMLINKELYKYLKEINFSRTLNEMGLTRPKYGGLLVKKSMVDGELKIDVVDWKNVDCDPVDILGGAIIETFNLLPSDLASKRDVWENVDEVLKEYNKLAKSDKPEKIEVKEISGELPVAFYKECSVEGYKETEEDKIKFDRYCFYVACVNEKKYLMYYEQEKEIRYKYLPWERIPGRGLGRGVVEDGFEAQVWTNDSIITMKNAMELSGRVLLWTDSQRVSGNAITGVDHGHIFQLNKGDSLNQLNLSASSVPEIQNLVELWKAQYDRAVSTFDANTGEQPPSGTPYSQTALLNQVANSPFEYQRELWGIFLNEILNDWIFPHLKKRILKSHNLTAEFDKEELQMIDEAIKNQVGNDYIVEELLQNRIPGQEDMAMIGQQVEQELGKKGIKREIEIPEKFLDIKGRITANITGELKNKTAVLQSLAQIGRDIIATFNPQTGQYAALQDPALSKIYGSIIDLAGVPITSAHLKPTASADLTSINPNGQLTPTA